MWQQQLLESPDVQRAIVENAPTMVLLLDEQGRIAKVNAHFERKTGFAAETVIGKDWFAMFIPDADRPKIRDLFADVLEHGINSGHVNAILTAKGTRLEVEWFAQVIADPQRRTRWLLNIGHDITHRLEHEQALEAATREAERANAAKSRFLATASHDLRQPLQTLMILNSALEKLADGAPQQQQMLQMQRVALTGMRALLNALLDIGKLESGTVEPDIADVSVQDVFDCVRAELGPQAEEKGVKLIVEESALVARTDAGLLTQLVQNVVANAIRYTDRGSVRLACAADGPTLEIVVADTGIGIDEQQRELIFDEFYQIDRNVSDGGLGLGLSIVKRIADLLGFEIALESELGAGSTFRISVPAAADVTATRRELSRETAPGRDTGTVLIVDDDAAVLAASQLFFEIEGFEVVTAASPDEVAAELGTLSTPIDLIVTDYHLHDVRTGMDIVATVRERLGSMVPAIVMTGDTSESVGGTDVARLEVLSKPIQPQQLLATVHRLLADPD